MARTKTKGKATKRVVRKRVARTASAKRKTRKAAKKPRKRASKTVTSRALDLLSAWSPSRYSTR